MTAEQQQPIDADMLAVLLAGAEPPVLLDVRDPVEVERGHILGMTNLPRRRLEWRIGELVRDPASSIVVVDDDSGRAPLAAQTLVALGYTTVTWLIGGIAAWSAAGQRLATGLNVPSKLFGETVHHDDAVPSVDAATLLRYRAEGRRVIVCDVRTPPEHRQGCIPGAVSAPSFDIALHAADLARDHDLVVLHCAGRTRSIIATQTLRELGVDAVVALENGTMGWRLAGLAVETGSTRRLSAASAESAEAAEVRAAVLATRAGVGRIDADELVALLAKPQFNRHVFDVRSLADFQTGHIAGSTALPGGQAVQRTDDFVALRRTPILLIDEHEARASLAGMWLRRMGHSDVKLLAGGLHRWRAEGRPLEAGRGHAAPLGWAEVNALTRWLPVADAAALLADRPQTRVINVDTSITQRRGHVPGAVWLPRGWLELRVDELLTNGDEPLLVSCADGSQSAYACATLQRLGYGNAIALQGGTAAWAAAGFALEAEPMLAPQDDDWRPPYERGEQAMRDYIDWETMLVPRR